MAGALVFCPEDGPQLATEMGMVTLEAVGGGEAGWARCSWACLAAVRALRKLAPGTDVA